jgi:hypothetical protein
VLLRREDAGRTRAGIAGLVGGIALISAMIVTTLVQSGKPPVYVVEGLLDAAGKTIGRQGLLTEQLRFFDDRLPGLLGATALHVISLVGVALLLVYLFDATRGRRPETPALLRSLALAGISAYALGLVVAQVAQAISVRDFVTGNDFSTAAGHDASNPPAVGVSQIFVAFGLMAFGVAWGLIALNAMRAGLLTRFLGLLGIFCGVLTILPLVQIPVIQFFWLIALGLTILGRAPQGAPPAWSAGTAIPWPSQQELREQREAMKSTEDGGETGEPSPATSARKRRKRRT